MPTAKRSFTTATVEATGFAGSWVWRQDCLPLRYRRKTGGAEGVRTPDLLNAIQALYQLSYDPILWGRQSTDAFPIAQGKTIETEAPKVRRARNCDRIASNVPG